MGKPSVTELLTEDEISNRLALLGAGPAPDEWPYRLYRPLSAAVDEFVAWSQSRSQRVYTGIPPLDAAMRGIAPGELAMVLGFAHSAKTQVTLHIVNNNRAKRIAYFSPDETRSSVLVKLACMVHGVSAEELEARIYAKDQDAIGLVRQTAEAFPNLAVFDETFSIAEMDKALSEVEDHWGKRAELVIFDYLELLDGVEEVKGAANVLKSWGKRRKVPLLVLHQTSRSKGADGQEVTITSGGYGGEQQAIFIIGVRRKKHEIAARIKDIKGKLANPSSQHQDSLRYALQEAEHELWLHRNTVTLNLVKNKRPPCKLVDDVDFVLDESTGGLGEFVMQEQGRRPTITDAVLNRRSVSSNDLEQKGWDF